MIALLWTLDCFVGAYLTFPPALRQRPGPRTWFVRWLPMWLLKTSKLFSFIFTWHRASGLWLWLLLLVFGWSAVALNLSDYVYKPVMGALFGAADEPFERLPELKSPMKKPPLPLREAHALGQRLMAVEAERRNFRLLGERSLDYLPEHGVFAYTVESSLDIDERLAQTTLGFDGAGRVLAFQAPTGQHAAGTLTSWLIALHFGAVRELGLAYRIFVCVFGRWWRCSARAESGSGGRSAPRRRAANGTDRPLSRRRRSAAREIDFYYLKERPPLPHYGEFTPNFPKIDTCY